ncbi:hypothetical protein [Halococcus sp. IIIV-5B]|uniref:hypothetical protein n=1 Tax=Halococcus sp. IIIV-5B TaxID=2321230 RepID=UPI000E74D3DD|nr:hypothetical protein [Halococcus sp. IIIV-5B]RJT07178.1 hypothetical protein D3261_04020 [Halococcus sp. IIIV-5B]
MNNLDDPEVDETMLAVEFDGGVSEEAIGEVIELFAVELDQAAVASDPRGSTRRGRQVGA